MAKDSGEERRAQAATLRVEAELAARRDRRVKIVGGLVVALVVVGIVMAGVLGARSQRIEANPDNPRPMGTLSESYGFPLKPIDEAKSTLVIFEDPQCPICGLFEKTYGELITKFSAEGVVNVVYQMATFIDRNLPQSKNASRRAIGGLGCAIDQGVGQQYHELIYQNQPATEGEGFSDALLRGLGAAAGLKGEKLSAFEKCFDDGTYLGWADNQNQYFADEGIQGTPTLQLDGKQVPDSALADANALKAYITKNAKQ